jgi:hypothetical protein
MLLKIRFRSDFLKILHLSVVSLPCRGLKGKIFISFIGFTLEINESSGNSKYSFHLENLATLSL